MGTKEGEKQKYRDGKIKKIYIDKDRPTQGEKERLQRQIQSQKKRTKTGTNIDRHKRTARCHKDKKDK